MKWLLLIVSLAAAQPSLPLLPTGVTITMVKQIQVNTGGTIEFVKSVDDSATIAHRLPFSPVIKFDAATGILTVDPVLASGSSMLQPGLLATFLAVALCAFNSNRQHSALLVFCLGLGVASAGLVVADVTIRVPGCFHVDGANANILMFDDECADVDVAQFQAPVQPVASIRNNFKWEPITPATSFLPANDHGQHYLSPAQQYEVWRQSYGRAFDETERQNFFAFTEECRIQNLDPNRNWTAACNQFAHLTHSDWKTLILADNAALLANANAGARRLLSTDEVLFSEITESHRRQLLQTTEFTWVGKGKLTKVKDQGNCGSCYAHSSTSQMEAQIAILFNTQPKALSREQAKDCSTGSPGCNGGWPANMYKYAAATQGLGTEADYPYVAQNAACKSPPPTLDYKNTGYTSIANNELAFKAAVAIAPVAVTVCAGNWNNYAGGVFTNCGNSATCAVDHAVLLVGYGTDPTLGDYWLIQNSWNTWWGESGFMRLARTDKSAANTGACGLTRYVGYHASNPTSPSTTGTTTDCQGSWSSWGQCSKTCGGGTQSRTWTTSTPANGGVACPSPTTQSQACNTALCGGTATPACLRISNSVLGSVGDGDYLKSADWNQNWCGTKKNPQYIRNGNSYALFFKATNCYYGRKTAGMWGLGNATHNGVAYQWSGKVTIPSSGVIPGPVGISSWTLQISTGLNCTA